MWDSEDVQCILIVESLEKKDRHILGRWPVKVNSESVVVSCELDCLRLPSCTWQTQCCFSTKATELCNTCFCWLNRRRRQAVSTIFLLCFSSKTLTAGCATCTYIRRCPHTIIIHEEQLALQQGIMQQLYTKTLSKCMLTRTGIMPLVTLTHHLYTRIIGWTWRNACVSTDAAHSWTLDWLKTASSLLIRSGKLHLLSVKLLKNGLNEFHDVIFLPFPTPENCLADPLKWGLSSAFQRQRKCFPWWQHSH